jgi:hypothetical protein
MSITLTCDLRGQFGAARDQQTRPTCLAFAVTDTHGATFAPFNPLSVEYLYYHAVQLMPGQNPHAGINTSAAADSLRNHGQPVEAHWPYQPALPADLGAWTPPTNSPVFRRAFSTHTNSFKQICSQLTSGKPVIICLQLSESFYKPLSTGLVAQKTPDPMTGRHAVIAVGHGRTATEPCLLVRNSWGTGWGLGGYAFLEEGYLTGRLVSNSVLI